MLTRSAHVREKAIAKLHAVWETATPRERAKWISELRAAALLTLQENCSTLLRNQPADATHNTP